VTRIRELAAGDKQLLLLAYAHTLYLALLSGGVLLERMLRGAMLLPRGRGTEVFCFAELPPREQARFKRELRAAVDALGETLGEAERTALLQEKRSIFWRNDRLIIAVFQEARGSLVVAYARLARASIYAVLASPLVLVRCWSCWRRWRRERCGCTLRTLGSERRTQERDTGTGLAGPDTGRIAQKDQNKNHWLLSVE